MKDISSVSVMSSHEEHFQQDEDRNLDINSIPDRADTPMGQFGDLTNPVGASIMDWTERLIELTLSTDDVIVGTENCQTSSDTVINTSGDFFTSSADVLEVVTIQDIEDLGNLQGMVIQGNEVFSVIEQGQGGFSGSVSVAASQPSSPALESSLTVSMANAVSAMNSDMWDKNDLILSSWATEDLGGSSEPVITTASALSSFEIAGLTVPDHQYASPMKENVSFLSQSTGAAPSQHGSFDESFLDIQTSLPNAGTITGNLSDTAEIEKTTVSSMSLYSPRETVPISSSAMFNLHNYDTSTVSNIVSTSNSWLYDATSDQAVSSGDLTNNSLDLLGGEVNQTMMDITEAFIDYATVEVGPSESSVSTATENSYPHDQTLHDPSPVPTCYSGTVTICRADDISFSMGAGNSGGFQVSSSTSGTTYSSKNSSYSSQQSYLDLETLIPQALRSCLGMSDTADDPCLDVSSASYQGSEQNPQHQPVNLWDTDILIPADEERDERTYSSMETAGADVNTLDDVIPLNALYGSLHSGREKHNVSSVVSRTSLSAPLVSSLLGQTRSRGPKLETTKFSAEHSQLRITKPTVSVSSKASSPSLRQPVPKMSLLQPTTSLGGLSSVKPSQSASYFAFSRNPAPSELSTDALLSPSDVYRTFLSTSDSHYKVSQTKPSQSKSTSPRTRTVSDTSDISLTDSDVSGSYSVNSVASCAELENTDELRTGNKLKDTLRSRLKAKRRAAGLPEEVIEKSETGKSSSCSSGNLTPVPVDDHHSSSQSTRSSKEQQVLPSTSRGGDAQQRSILKVSKDKSVDDDDDDYDNDDDGEDDDESPDDSEDDDSSLSSAAGSKTNPRKRKGNQPEDDEETKLAKREKNRLAARKCRHKKVTKIETLTAQVHRLEEKQTRIKTEVDRLEMEREQLEEMLRLHSLVCPTKGKRKQTK